MLPVLWLPSAQHDMAGIFRFIANENPSAARRLKNHIQESVMPVSEHPYLYRKSDRAEGLRELVVHTNYAVLYRVTAVNIEIVAVVHTRQEYPKNE